MLPCGKGANWEMMTSVMTLAVTLMCEKLRMGHVVEQPGDGNVVVLTV